MSCELFSCVGGAHPFISVSLICFNARKKNDMIVKGTLMSKDGVRSFSRCMFDWQAGEKKKDTLWSMEWKKEERGEEQ